MTKTQDEAFKDIQHGLESLFVRHLGHALRALRALSASHGVDPDDETPMLKIADSIVTGQTGPAFTTSEAMISQLLFLSIAMRGKTYVNAMLDDIARAEKDIGEAINPKETM